MGVVQARFWRRIYLGISLSLGIISPLICWYMIPGFNPITKPLSYFGVAELTAWYWNASLIIIAFGIYLNAKKSLPRYFKKTGNLKVLRILLSISFVALCLTAIVSMDNSLLHRISASTFFLTYNLFVFCFGFFRSSKYVRKGMFSMIIGSLMLLSSLLLLPLPSSGVFEIIYFLLLLIWNGTLFYKRVKTEDRSMDKKLVEAKTTPTGIS